jgi:hypothetical protein
MLLMEVASAHFQAEQSPTPTAMTRGKLVRSQKFEWRTLKLQLADLREQKEKLSRKDPLFKKKKREIAREMKRLVADMKSRQNQVVEDFDANHSKVCCTLVVSVFIHRMTCLWFAMTQTR